MNEYKMCPNTETAIQILDFIKSEYEKRYKDCGVKKYIEALEMGIDALKNKQTADVVEVKHGKWTRVEVTGNGYGQTYYQHKNCAVASTELYQCSFEYCPRCGAEMDSQL